MTGNDTSDLLGSCSDLQHTFRRGLLSDLVNYIYFPHPEEPMYCTGEIMRPKHFRLLQIWQIHRLSMAKYSNSPWESRYQLEVHRLTIDVMCIFLVTVQTLPEE